mmetsp:Transcript_108196/g.170577  ORF Transcript_108196/g.170577 Transcript_108196/m.170577 type:complete len:98 (+) Transcript_108196:63-356(+)|eukprot:CAMPEP_0169071278 /NCGR_PEP_ID=MMETSP1015-20121227/5573_1 /TAXON_ID=342587 /ORGANISM="Karlodinium micrum, Strain CCMP2283" /LENGTH=97 /DNA_ID=CAMNT_0009130351 /DNA_START=60 /DNA_END=353 /DNA_ORIENTATION=+
MDQKDAQVQKARELQAAIEQMSQQCDQISAEVNRLQGEYAQNDQTVQQWTKRLHEINAILPQKKQQLQQLTAQQSAEEERYMKMLEATPALVHVLKK